MAKRNFLLGKGERLTEPVQGTSGPVKKIAPYTFSEAKERLRPMVENVAKEVEQLPSDACPDDLAVASIILNPEYIAKSYYPSDLLRSVGLETVGSRNRYIKPEKKSRGRQPEEAITTELFVIGRRPSFKRWANLFGFLEESNPGAEQIVAIEQIAFPKSGEKIKSIDTDNKKKVYEVVLHVDEEYGEKKYLELFKNYLNKFDLKPDFKHRFYAGGLCFLEMETPAELVSEIAQFSLVRAIRTMPSLRLLNPATRITNMDNSIEVDLPDVDPVNPDINVAIFDGGIPEDHPICRWVTPIDGVGVGPSHPEFLKHGVGVTSAFLFGHIDPKKPLPKPYAYVDHYRVLDIDPTANARELYEVLERIDNVLTTKKYDFINLSIGPALPVDDDDVHAWTAVLDDHLSKGTLLATIAVGNDGEKDASIGANRVQVPGDCVNGLCIGACDTPESKWQKASYSSVGPGRSPGLVKPDLVEFGGSIDRPFLTLDSENGLLLSPTSGTSFSTPSTMRMGVGVKAHFGNSLNALAIKALLIHCCERADLPEFEVGWGRVARLLEDVVICDDYVMRVVYQGSISASKYVRVPIPLPSVKLDGMVKIKATICYATSVDPNHPGNYTRSGLEIVFRPNKDVHADVKVDGKKTEQKSFHPQSKPFFTKTQKQYATEEDLRRDAWKWENCLHSENRFRGTSLNDPMFDIHYNARSEGHNDTSKQEISYAMVITVEAPKVKDLYDQIVRKYATQLEQLQPVIELPLKV